jgi:hypothetical protein
MLNIIIKLFLNFPEEWLLNFRIIEVGVYKIRY